jgi:hypothetical protein
MKIICVYLDMSNFEINSALAHIANNFLCQIDSNVLGMSGFAEISIECFMEDAPAIENILSPFV